MTHSIESILNLYRVLNEFNRKRCREFRKSAFYAMHFHSMLYHALYQRTERYQFYTNGKMSMASDAAAAAKRRHLAFILSFKNANIKFNELWLVCLACHETCVHSAHHGAFDETLRKLRVVHLSFGISNSY